MINDFIIELEYYIMVYDKLYGRGKANEYIKFRYEKSNIYHLHADELQEILNDLIAIVNEY